MKKSDGFESDALKWSLRWQRGDRAPAPAPTESEPESGDDDAEPEPLSREQIKARLLLRDKEKK